MDARVDTEQLSLPNAAASNAASRVGPKRGAGSDRTRTALVLGLPAQVISLLVLVMPLLMALYMSFTDWSPTHGSLASAEFVGVQNFQDLIFEEPRFLEAVARTLVFAVVCMSLEFTLGLGLALLFQRAFAGKKVFFSLMLTPMMILPVVVGYTFWMLFQSNGPINQMLTLVLGHAGALDWLRDEHLACLAVVLTEVWHWTPLFFLILYSGLNAVPENPVRAAIVLGATPRQVFWHVVLPMIKPVIVVAFVIRGMEIIKLFDEVYLLTRGGPGTSTETISLYIYKLAFNDFQLAYGAAAAFLVLVGTLVIIHLMLLPISSRLVERRS